MKWRRTISLGLAAAMTASTVLAGCGGDSGANGNASSGDNKNQTAATEEGGSQASGDVTTIEVYDVAANYQGMQAGWFGDLVKEKFGLELNIFAPNTSGDAAALYQTRCSSGKLGDIILLDNADYLDCVEAGLVMDITDDIWNYPNLAEYKTQIEAFNAQVGDGSKIWGIPTEMTNTSPETYSQSTPFSAPCLPWDYYKELGCPELKNLDDLLDVLEQMQKAHPTNDAGDKAYAISLWKDWDGFGMEHICQTAKWYGQEVNQSVLIGNDNSMMPLIDENGAYYKMLEFFFKANQRGLIDPDSSVQDWTTTDEQKLRAYRKYLLWYNWEMNLAGINLSDEDKAAGKGFVNVPVEDLNIYQVADSYYGSGRVWGIGSGVDDATKEKIMQLFDWMASPEGISYMWDGIAGVNYTIEEGTGRYAQTDDSVAYVAGKKNLPDEWGGGLYNDGKCQLNQYIVSNMAVNPNNNEPYSMSYWSTNLEKPKDQRYVDWTEKYGTDTQTEYFEENGLLKTVANVNVVLESDTTDIALIRSQCGKEITNASWKMVFAADQAEFDALWENLKETLTGIGWDDLVKFDMEKYQKVIDTRKAAK